MPRQDSGSSSGPVAAVYWAKLAVFLPRQDPPGTPNPVASSMITHIPLPFLPTDSFSKLTTECVYCSLHAFCVHESSHIAICLDTECVLDRIYAFYGQLLVCCALGFVMSGLSFLRHARSDFLSSCPAPTGHLVHRLLFLRISLAIADLSLTPLQSNTSSPSAEKPDQRKKRVGYRFT